jgi:hypothetical protein
VRSSALSHSVLVKLRSYISGIVGLAPQSTAPPRPPNLSSKPSQDIATQSVCGETTESTIAICCNPRASVVRRRLRTSATGTTNGCAFQQKWWCGAWLRAIMTRYDWVPSALGRGVGGGLTGIVMTNRMVILASLGWSFPNLQCSRTDAAYATRLYDCNTKRQAREQNILLRSFLT